MLAAAAGALAVIPATALAVVEESGGRRVWCASPSPWGVLTVRFISRNSIYGAIAEETWEIDAAGITIVRVQSAPIVLDYYGIANYRLLPDGSAEGEPLITRYPEIRLKASPRGEQRLVTGVEQFDVSTRFAEGEVLIIKPRLANRFAACGAE